MQGYTKMTTARYPDVILKVIPGHFVTSHSHINYYIDMTTMKTRLNEAAAAAAAISENFATSTVVDTIVCMGGMEVIGTLLAEKLTSAGVLSMNAHKTIYVVTPDYDAAGNMIFRDNASMMIKGKHVLLLLASTTTGITLQRAGEAINYYGGTVVGIQAIFSAVSTVAGMSVHALFTTKDLPKYMTYSPHDCPLCRQRVPVDAICNDFGYSKV